MSNNKRLWLNALHQINKSRSSKYHVIMTTVRSIELLTSFNCHRQQSFYIRLKLFATFSAIAGNVSAKFYTFMCLLYGQKNVCIATLQQCVNKSWIIYL